MEYDFSAAETFDSPPPLTESDLFSAQHPRESDSSDSSGGSLLSSGKLFIFFAANIHTVSPDAH